MATAKMSMAITEHGDEDAEDRRPLVRHYQAQELIPPRRPVLHNLLDKQLSAWASVQAVSGVLSFGLGLVFASTVEFSSSLIILFRIPFLNGAMFFIAGLLSNLLHREPRLLPVSLTTVTDESYSLIGLFPCQPGMYGLCCRWHGDHVCRSGSGHGEASTHKDGGPGAVCDAGPDDLVSSTHLLDPQGAAASET
ncbi:uncharacterized protein si:ch211-269k10.4 isoform X1 [Sardina pilchardus]|uniref:uncharacterized protein si:ch211-269k10.4 isoform X1 n=1 Tax=Sardina pilchardus TaxID=27697 RepID=UPI002E124446